MGQRDIELALKKQRLQLQSSELRNELVVYGRGIEPAFTAADLARQGWLWLRARPAILVTIGVALVVARPRLVFRWGRRAWVGWQTVSHWRGLIAPPVNPVRERNVP